MEEAKAFMSGIASEKAILKNGISPPKNPKPYVTKYLTITISRSQQNRHQHATVANSLLETKCTTAGEMPHHPDSLPLPLVSYQLGEKLTLTHK